MAYTVTYEHPHFPTGSANGEDEAPVREFGIMGLAASIPNGSSVEIDEDTERGFLMTRGQTLEDALANDPFINISGTSSLDQNEVDQILAQFAVPETPTEQPVSNATTNIEGARIQGNEITAEDLGLGESNA